MCCFKNKGLSHKENVKQVSISYFPKTLKISVPENLTQLKSLRFPLQILKKLKLTIGSELKNKELLEKLMDLVGEVNSKIEIDIEV